MAYSPKNLRCHAGPDNSGGNISVAHEPGVSIGWTYKSSDAVATVRAANYFTDAFLRGMRAGDTVTVVVQSSGTVSAVSICVVMACTAAGADLSDGTSISVTNT